MSLSLKKILPAAVLSAALLFSGCFHRGPVYSTEEEEAVNDTGREQAEEWISRYWPGGEVRSVEPHVFMYGSGPHYLTDYAEGILFDGEKERSFTINIVTGEMFVMPDEAVWEEFLEAVRELYLESLSLPTELEVKYFDAGVIAGLMSSEDSGNWADSECVAAGLPGELVAENGDVRAYVSDPDRGKDILVDGWIDVPDETDLSVYTPEDLGERQKKYGLSYDNYVLQNRFESVSPSGYKRSEEETGSETEAETEAENTEESTTEKDPETESPEEKTTEEGSAEEGSAEAVVLENPQGDGKNYHFTYAGETFDAIYTPDNWKVVDSWKITKKEDMIRICQALCEAHPIHGADGQSYRTAEDMAYEWIQHNLAYELLPEDNPWREHAKDVDLDPRDQGKTIDQIYEDRTGEKFDINEFH